MSDHTYIVMVVSFDKHDAEVEVYGGYAHQRALRKLTTLLREFGMENAEDIVAQHDWEDGDFKYDDVGLVVQMTRVPLGK